MIVIKEHKDRHLKIIPFNFLGWPHANRNWKKFCMIWKPGSKRRKKRRWKWARKERNCSWISRIWRKRWKKRRLPDKKCKSRKVTYKILNSFEWFERSRGKIPEFDCIDFRISWHPFISRKKCRFFTTQSSTFWHPLISRKKSLVIWHLSISWKIRKISGLTLAILWFHEKKYRSLVFSILLKIWKMFWLIWHPFFSRKKPSNFRHLFAPLEINSTLIGVLNPERNWLKIWSRAVSREN